MKYMIAIAVLLLCVMAVNAKEADLDILAVSELPDGGFEGSIANLNLDLEPGTGRVFMDTQPSSKLDTQLSTRFATRVACNYLKKDCDEYDFFYTIKANSAIVGGPSASAAAAILAI